MQYKIIVDKQPSSNPSDEKKEYIIDIEELRVKGDVYDSLNIDKDKTYVTRRLSLSEYGVLSVLDEPVTEELTDVEIKLFEGDNYVYLSDMQGNKFYAEYLIKNDFNDIYATKNEMNSSITQTAESIEFSVNQKLEGYSTTEEMNAAIDITAQGINSEVSKKVGKDEVVSSINQSAEEIQIDANKISLEGKEIDLTSDDISITSEGLSVDKNGKMILKSQTDDTIPSIKIVNPAQEDIYVEITSGKLNAYADGVNRTSFYYNIGSLALRAPSGGATYHTPGFSSYRNNNDESTVLIYGSDGLVRCTKLEQTSLESIKKNISKFNKNATDIINNSDIYEYNLKSDKDTDKKMIGFVIGDKYRTPAEVIEKNGQAIELYSAIGILWKAVQELSARVEQLEKEVSHE